MGRYSREQVEVLVDTFVQTLDVIIEKGGRGVNDPYFPQMTRLGRDIIDGANGEPSLARTVSEKLAQAYNLSLDDAGYYLADPEALEHEKQAEQEIIYGPDSINERLVDVLGPPEDSVLSDYVMCFQEAEAPLLYHPSCLMTAVAATLKRRVWMDWNQFEIFPNLYTILVGPTGSRKNTAINSAMKMVRGAYPNLHVLPVDSSPQGMADMLGMRYQRSGVSDGLLLAPEMKVMFGKDRYKDSFGVWLTDMYDCPDEFKRALRREKIEMYSLYLNLMAGSTMAWLQTMPEDVVTGGFIPRTLIAYSPGKGKYVYRPNIDKGKLKDIQNKLKLALLEAHGEMSLDRKADSYLKEWYEEELPAEAAVALPEAAPYYERILPNTLKVSMIMHIIEGFDTDKISLTTVKKAKKFMELLKDGTLAVMQQLAVNEETRAVDAVDRVIDAHNGRCPKDVIFKKLQRKLAARRIHDAISALEYSGTIKNVGIGKTGSPVYVKIDLEG